MYPLNSYVHATFSENDFNPNLEIQDLTYSSSCLFHFPSPLNQYEDEALYLQHFHAIASQNDLANIGATHEMTVPEITENSSQNNAGMKEHMSAGGSTDQPVVKKNLCKKDRHSKIDTAHGPRDRRMRLSLDVARMFFALQDILGYDKASKTVEWLFKQSKPAIKKLTGEFPQTNKGSGVFSPPSDCIVVSGIDQSVPETGIDQIVPETASIKTELPSTRIKKKRVKRVRKATFYPFTKESRKYARERARERTSNKKRQQQLDDQQLMNIMTWSLTGTVEKLAGSSHYTVSYNSPTPTSLDEVEEMQKACEQKMKISRGTKEESINVSDPSLLVIAGNWSSTALSNYHHGSDDSHEFADFQFYGYHN